MSLKEEPGRTELEWSGGVGGTNYRGLWGKGAVGCSLPLEFSCGGRNQGRAGGDLGARESAQVSGSKSGVSGIPSAGLCLEGAEGALGRDFGRSRSADLFPSEGRHHSRVTLAL